MPARSSNSFIRRWPDRDTVHAAVTQWAEETIERDQAVTRIGYAGSYARGDWGLGSDVDIIILVNSTEEPSERRALSYDATRLPVPADVIVYTESEWEDLRSRSGAFQEVVWCADRDSNE